MTSTSPTDPTGGSLPRDLVTIVHLADARVVLRCDSRLNAVHQRLAGLFDTDVDHGGDPRTVTVRLDVDEQGRIRVGGPGSASYGNDESEAVGLAISAVNAAVLLESDCLTIHAGAVLGRHGVIAWPAASGAGQSTLVAAALRRGFDLVSDESLCLDLERHVVLPYPKPLTLSAWAADRVGSSGRAVSPSDDGELAVNARDLGARGCATASPLQAVVLLRRGSPLALEPAGSDKAAVALLRHSFNHFRMPARALETVHRVLVDATVWELGYDDPVEAAGLLAESFAVPSSSTAE